MEARFPHGDETHMGMDMSNGAATAEAAMGGMDGHSMGGMGSMDGHSMGMMAVFQTNMQTSLYSAAWTPTNAGTYAATCIFLVFLAMLMRFLLAGKALIEQRWLDQELKRRYVVVAGKGTLDHRLSTDSDAKQMVISENGKEENVTVVQRKSGHKKPWRFSVDPVRAVLDTIIAGVGYLLMLAVMSMNVGYFLSILGGVFLGSIFIGRYAIHSEH